MICCYRKAVYVYSNEINNVSLYAQQNLKTAALRHYFAPSKNMRTET